MEPLIHFLNLHLLTVGGSVITPKLLLTLLVALVLLFAITAWLQRWGTARVLKRRPAEAGAVQALFQIVRYVLLLVGIIVIVQSVGINLSAFVVVVGTLGIGIGLAVQPLLTNFLSGLVLLIERPLKIGDRIEMGTIAGTVMAIGGRATNVRTNDNINVIVPNSQLVSSQIINWSHDDRRVRLSIPVGVAYGADPRQVERVLLEVARANTGVLAEPAPDVLLDSFGDSSIAFELRVWTETYLEVPRSLRSELNCAIYEAFRAAAIELPFPQRDVHIRSFVAVPAAPPIAAVRE